MPQFNNMRHTAIILILMELYRTVMNFLILTMVDDDHEDIEIMMTACRLLSVQIASMLTERVAPLRIENYVERVIPGQTATQFRENFRITPDVFDVLLKEFAPLLKCTNKYNAVTKNLDPRKQILSVLWILATPESYRSVSERFNMSKSSLHRSFISVCKVLNSRSNRIIKWPQGREEIVARKFSTFAGIPGVIGAVDGSYIPIKAPEQYPERYINRKCYHAITLQAICDGDLMFTDVYAGYPSSVSDRRVFENSDIFQNVVNGRIVIPQKYFILGDKAYPVLRWCIPPFIERGPLTVNQTNFNVAVSKTRQCIERAFALLKGRFRRLKYLDMGMVHFIPSVILACCVLHNICLMNRNNKSEIENFIREEMPNVDGEDNDVNDPIQNGNERVDFRNSLILEMVANQRL